MLRRPRYSLAALLIVVAAICLALAVYRDLNPPPVAPLPLSGMGAGSEENTLAFNFQYSTKISEETLSRAPAWDRRDPNPPLSAVDAMVRADHVRNRLIKDKKLEPEGGASGGYWELVSAELIPLDASIGKWSWRVRFHYRRSGTGPPDELALFVLMDGTVIEPEISRWQYQWP
jgi:hypothetical protein